MRVAGPGSVQRTNVGRPRRSGEGTGTFRVSNGDSQHDSAPVSGSAPPAATNPLLALQEVPDPTEQHKRSKPLARAHEMLDDLEGVRLGLLQGALTESQLRRLQGRLETFRDRDDGNLSPLLDEIEVRAAVELAKLDMSR